MKTVLQNMTNCTGCRACEKVCAFQAITMTKNEEGFLYPKIDGLKCTDCGMCRNTCPAQKDVEHRQPLEIFAAVHKDECVLLDSSSGGVFTALADIVFSKGGVVVGCVLDKDFRAKQVIINSHQFLQECRGSKYVQSDTCDTYSEVKRLLDAGVYVLYTGTPCQIAGLKKYLNQDYDNLLTGDFVCHGVPSPELFVKHITWLEKKNHHKIMRYRFRSKVGPYQFGWYYYYYFTNAVKVIGGSAVLDPYYIAFLNAKTYRECCYHCPYAEEKRISDFTFADYWSIEKYHPKMDTNNGASILLFNTEKALKYQREVNEKMHLVPSRMEWIKQVNFNLNQPAERPEERNHIYLNIRQNGYTQWAEEYCSTLGWKLRMIYGKLPLALRMQIKKILKR